MHLSKDRIEPCKFYVCEGQCTKGRSASHKWYCQKCSRYVPRVRKKHMNEKKQKLEKIRKDEVY